MNFIQCVQCEYEKCCSLRDIASDLDGCSGHSKLHHRYIKERNELIAQAADRDRELSLKNKEILDTLEPGDRVKFVGNPKSYVGCSNIPQYVSGSVMTVLGFTKNGNVKCDYDGGKPFNIPPRCLRLVQIED